MDGMVEENGTSGGAGGVDPLGSAGSSAAAGPHVVAVTSIVQLTLPTQAPSSQVFILKLYQPLAMYMITPVSTYMVCTVYQSE